MQATRVPSLHDRHRAAATSGRPSRLSGALRAALLAPLLWATMVTSARASGLEFVGAYVDGAGGFNGLSGAESIAISPDDEFVYAGGSDEDAIAIMRRNATTGALTFVGTVADDQGGVDGLNEVRGLAISPDGANLYAVGHTDGAVAVFERNEETGLLSFIEVKKDGTGGVTKLAGAMGVSVSPDGGHVYVASNVNDAVVVFSRNGSTGRLTLVEELVDGSGGITSLDGAEMITMSPDGAHVYVAAEDDDAITVFSRNAGTGVLSLVEVKQEGSGGMTALDRVQSVAVSPDGAHLYAASGLDNAVVVFGRNATSGALSLIEVHRDGSAGINGLDGAEWVTVSPNGAYVYAVSDVDDALAVFGRDAATGHLTYIENFRDSQPGVTGLDGAEAVIVNGGSMHVYTAADIGNAVAVFGNLCGNGLANAGEACDDGNTQNGDCCTAACAVVAAGSACPDDGSVCTNDVCNGAGICLHTNNTIPCDDGAFCTVGDVCQSGVCQGTARNCSAAGNQCNAGVCDESLDQCAAQPIADGTTCADGNACTQTDTCQAGVCAGASPVICTVLDQCHDGGVCNPATGVCSNPEKVNGTSCIDGNACTQTDTCQAGVCAGASPVICAALDQCHDGGVCNPATGVCSNPEKANGTTCIDGNACTQTDTCQAGVCAGASPVICAALDQCHDAGVCNPATGLCSNPAKPDETALFFPVDADAYTDSSLPSTNFGSASSLRVDASPDRRAYMRFTVAGITGMPIEAAIVRLHTAADSTAGSDEGGALRAVGGGAWNELTIAHASRPALAGPVLASAGSIEPSQAVDFDVTGFVGADGIYDFAIEGVSTNLTIYRSREDGVGAPELIVFLSTSCDDGDACTQKDVCLSGTCFGAEPIVCTALDQCHDAGVCNPATGICSDPPAATGTPCDDGSLCTQADACMAGACVGADPVICTALDQCHDAGVCNPATGSCSNPEAAAGTPCDDGDACTQTDTCAAGACFGANLVACTALDQCHQAGICDPDTGLCSDPAAVDGTACNDGSLCTQADACVAGACVGADPVICTPLDQCHEAGSCEPSTGACSNPAKGDGASCDDGNACTQTDSCVAGACVGSDAIVCTAQDQCHNAGTCTPTTGQCTNPIKTNGSPCSDGSLCTQTDTCQAGICSGQSPVVCTPVDQCHSAGVCNPATGTCSSPVKGNGASCDDGNGCTTADTCAAGTCTGGSPVVCAAVDQCHDAGVCNPSAGTCSSPEKADGTVCDDGDACSADDLCVDGQCVGAPVPDGDGDGTCDAIDVCPDFPDAGQWDTDGDGIGDACQCNLPIPGRCIAGGGSTRTDCFLELITRGPVRYNRKYTRIKYVLQCYDGQAECDADGARDGQCTFTVGLCFGNADPRFPRCNPEDVMGLEVVSPNASRAASIGSRTNAKRLEDAIAALGLEVRRRGETIAQSVAPMGEGLCGPAINLVTPAPEFGKKVMRRTFKIRARGENGRLDTDRFVLVCK